MKLKYIVTISIVCILLASCKKDDTEQVITQVKCGYLNIALTNLGTNPIDSVYMVVNDANATFDSTFINPPSGFKFVKEFCGEYSFSLKFYHVLDTKGWEVNIDQANKKVNPIPVNGNTELSFNWAF